MKGYFPAIVAVSHPLENGDSLRRYIIKVYTKTFFLVKITKEKTRPRVYQAISGVGLVIFQKHKLFTFSLKNMFNVKSM
jgi:hypothetical protein